MARVACKQVAGLVLRSPVLCARTAAGAALGL